MTLDIRMRVPNCAAVVGNNVGHLVGASCLALNLAELELSFLGVNCIHLESSLGVIENSEVLSCLFNADYVHYSERESGVSSYLAINLDEPLLVFHNFDCFLSSEGIPKSVSQKD